MKRPAQRPRKLQEVDVALMLGVAAAVALNCKIADWMRQHPREVIIVHAGHPWVPARLQAPPSSPWLIPQ